MCCTLHEKKSFAGLLLTVPLENSNAAFELTNIPYLHTQHREEEGVVIKHHFYQQQQRQGTAQHERR
jgi:hypothetical protein